MTTTNQDPVVVCGIGCRLAGDVEGWSGLRRALYRQLGTDDRPTFSHPDTEPGTDLPRWKRPEHANFGDETLQEGVRVGQVTYESWDPEFFGISPAEATSVKPNTRLLLQSTWHALEDAGLKPSALAGKSIGVFMATDGEDGFMSLGLENRGRSCEALRGAAFVARLLTHSPFRFSSFWPIWQQHLLHRNHLWPASIRL